MRRFFGGFIDGKLGLNPVAIFTSRLTAENAYEDVREVKIIPVIPTNKLSVPGASSSSAVAPRGPGRRKNRGKQL